MPGRGAATRARSVEGVLHLEGERFTVEVQSESTVAIRSRTYDVKVSAARFTLRPTGVQVWSELGSPYIMTGGVAVEPGALLVIGPGVDVRVHSGGNRFVVHGRFVAMGLEGEEVTFDSAEDPPVAWGLSNGIRRRDQEVLSSPRDEAPSRQKQG